jgi:nucleotide-binding universal stress UspA family protein
MFNRIVVPLDGSPIAEQSLTTAEEFSKRLAVPLHLVRVIDIVGLERYGAHGLAVEYSGVVVALEAEREAATDYLAKTKEKLTAAGFEVTTEMADGQAARVLVELTKPDDLIVMATHGRSGLRRWVLGSVTEDVVRHAKVPVLIVRATAKGKTNDVRDEASTEMGSPVSA